MSQGGKTSDRYSRRAEDLNIHVFENEREKERKKRGIVTLALQSWQSGTSNVRTSAYDPPAASFSPSVPSSPP